MKVAIGSRILKAQKVRSIRRSSFRPLGSRDRRSPEGLPPVRLVSVHISVISVQAEG
jgi:hypothetical protein